MQTANSEKSLFHLNCVDFAFLCKKWSCSV